MSAENVTFIAESIPSNNSAAYMYDGNLLSYHAAGALHKWMRMAWRWRAPRVHDTGNLLSGPPLGILG